jgi:hypothetical protein
MAQTTSVAALVDEIGKVRELGQALVEETGDSGEGGKQERGDRRR